MPTTIPDNLIDLVERPYYGSLGTVRPDDTVQVNPMWFDFDGTTSGSPTRPSAPSRARLDGRSL